MSKSVPFSMEKMRYGRQENKEHRQIKKLQGITKVFRSSYLMALISGSLITQTRYVHLVSVLPIKDDRWSPVVFLTVCFLSFLAQIMCSFPGKYHRSQGIHFCYMLFLEQSILHIQFYNTILISFHLNNLMTKNRHREGVAECLLDICD